MKSGAPEGLTFPAPHASPVMMSPVSYVYIGRTDKHILLCNRPPYAKIRDEHNKPGFEDDWNVHVWSLQKCKKKIYIYIYIMLKQKEQSKYKTIT